MRGESESEIDFVVVEEGCVNRVVKMIIHFEVPQSDHNWIEVCVGHEGGKVDMTPRWIYRRDRIGGSTVIN